MVKAFYTSGILFDILDQFGNLSDDIEEKRKYAKWRAAYIHNCLKKGVMPTPGSTIVLNDNDEYNDFLPKSELDKIKGRTPEKEDNDDEGFPESSSTPSSSNTPTVPPSWPNELPSQPLLPNIPSQPIAPSPTVTPSVPPSQNIQPIVSPSTNATLSPEQMEKAQKYCKYANSALNYDDVKTAIDNLQKALHLLQFGQEM